MNSTSRINRDLAGALLCLVLAMPLPLPGQGKKQRDLKLEKDPPAKTEAPQAVKIPRSYALVVGVSAYQNLPATHQLQFPDRDAEAIYSTLISSEGGNFRAENVHKLIGPKATLAKLRYELEEWLPSVTKDDDRVLIYFAGHGFVYGGKGYLAPYDFDLKNIAGTGYAMDTLGTAISGKIHGKWKVLLTDSCHSGAIRTDADVQLINGRLAGLNPSLFSMTASRDRERSFDRIATRLTALVSRSRSNSMCLSLPLGITRS